MVKEKVLERKKLVLINLNGTRPIKIENGKHAYAHQRLSAENHACESRPKRFDIFEYRIPQLDQRDIQCALYIVPLEDGSLGVIYNEEKNG